MQGQQTTLPQTLIESCSLDAGSGVDGVGNGSRVSPPEPAADLGRPPLVAGGDAGRTPRVAAPRPAPQHRGSLSRTVTWQQRCWQHFVPARAHKWRFSERQRRWIGARHQRQWDIQKLNGQSEFVKQRQQQQRRRSRFTQRTSTGLEGDYREGSKVAVSRRRTAQPSCSAARSSSSNRADQQRRPGSKQR